MEHVVATGLADVACFGSYFLCVVTSFFLPCTTLSLDCRSIVERCSVTWCVTLMYMGWEVRYLDLTLGRGSWIAWMMDR